MSSIQIFLAQILYDISNFLLIPVILSLLFMLAWMVMTLGGFFAEWFEKNKSKSVFQGYLKRMMQNSYAQREIIFKQFCGEEFYGFIEKFAHSVKDTPIDRLKMAKIIDDIEVESAGKIAKVALGIRVGPMLGLMGTLIPLGPGLVALAEGDISKLANYLIIAFTSTVIGLLIGAVSYIITQIRRRWYAQDLNNLKFIYEYYFWKEEE